MHKFDREGRVSFLELGQVTHIEDCKHCDGQPYSLATMRGGSHVVYVPCSAVELHDLIVAEEQRLKAEYQRRLSFGLSDPGLGLHPTTPGCRTPEGAAT